MENSTMPKFIVYWKDKTSETIEGDTIAQAFTHAGYGEGALKALDYYEKVRVCAICKEESSEFNQGSYVDDKWICNTCTINYHNGTVTLEKKKEDSPKYNSIIFVSILNKDNIAIQNKVALRFNSESESINKVAEDFLKEVCHSDKLVPDFFHYEVYIQNCGEFYKVNKEIK